MSKHLIAFSGSGDAEIFLAEHVVVAGEGFLFILAHVGKLIEQGVEIFDRLVVPAKTSARRPACVMRWATPG